MWHFTYIAFAVLVMAPMGRGDDTTCSATSPSKGCEPEKYAAGLGDSSPSVGPPNEEQFKMSSLVQSHYRRARTLSGDDPVDVIIKYKTSKADWTDSEACPQARPRLFPRQGSKQLP
jgi:hypothetical protein